MPMIRVEMFPGRSHEQKQNLVKALTDAFCETAGGTPESVHIVLSEIDQDSWSVAGTLISDKELS